MPTGKTRYAVAVALALVLLTDVAVAESLPAQDSKRAKPTPSAASLAQFYPAPLSTSPVGVDEDHDVWLAKVQGLIANAPQWLQQNVLASQNAQEFQANLALLEQMQEGAIKQRAGAVKRLAMRGNTVAKEASPRNPGANLGSPGASDMVYTALEPCRIMDTRNAPGGSLQQGPLVGNFLYNLVGYIGAGTTWGFAGGAASDCGLNSKIGTNIAAVVLIITILNPNFDAFLGVSDVNNLTTVLSTVALNYTHGQGLSTMYVVPQVSSHKIYFAMPAGLSANIIFDVVGYFATSQATALECLYPPSSGDTTVYPPGYLIHVVTPGCPAGYAATGTHCEFYDPFGWGGDLIAINLQACDWINATSSAQSGTSFSAVSVCCRIPGR